MTTLASEFRDSNPVTRDAPLLQRSISASTAVHCSSSPHSTLTELFRSPKKKSGGHDSSNWRPRQVSVGQGNGSDGKGAHLDADSLPVSRPPSSLRPSWSFPAGPLTAESQGTLGAEAASEEECKVRAKLRRNRAPRLVQGPVRLTEQLSAHWRKFKSGVVTSGELKKII
ncbi:uncharacterized protein LOC125027400 [Penaeus chinensis]|uniref:uncharacterized protein LOC125027400 n=1 Tax=Penaeus chinensis TaxID=139456 RepID=UPI001FB8004B|nr:uncharacterized protein LOC125027400 [Penaeus chinensis]